MASYKYKQKDINTFLDDIYNKGLKKSDILSDDDISKMVLEIGIFKIKGYIYALKSNLANYSIDDVFTIYYFDKYLTKYIMDLTSSVEARLKSTLIELCYSRTKNPFFYLISKNHKNSSFFINKETLKNWKNINPINISNESYLHYGIYYRQKYDFESNIRRYLSNETLIDFDTSKYNLPPFHYLVESATLGSIIYFIKSLKINNFDVFNNVSKSFGINNSSIFDAYLERLNEIRNRAAHRERLFNRSYRTVKSMGFFANIRKKVNEHRMIDVILFLYYMVDKLDFKNYFEFENSIIKKLFSDFLNDFNLNIESKSLLQKLDDSQKLKQQTFILNSMK